MSKKVEVLARQFLKFSADDVREFQRILESKGFLVGVTIVPDSWMREHGVIKSAVREAVTITEQEQK